ncbi:MAG: tRNA (adenosine(37)-N6)-threonylcarbamoyltransferase complex ATPase subunit type 1 TsaE [Rhodobacteraceae bacterium]|nr:tRNA (adenosine(37)-N6)-threonylcarbamoyltransferase complex ATPase subunit type 1 TsaE [Paracoccaceae bacterium]
MLPSPAETEALGGLLANALRPGDALFLIGEMGAGKSALARAIILARLAQLGRTEETPSPTYTLTQSYDLEDGLELIHADLYRLSGADEVEELGLLDPGAPTITLIEWPDRLGDAAPLRRLEVHLAIPPDHQGRHIAITALGGGWEAVAATVRTALPPQN